MEWISVKEQTPKDFEEILFTDRKRVFKGMKVSPDYFGDEDNEDCYYYSNERNYKGITHWMPLPELPTLDRKIYYEKNDVAG